VATDIDHQRLGLREYRDSLARHLDRLTEEYRSVQGCWRALDQEYAGHAAEEFRQRWATTSHWFDEYLDALRRMIAMLDERTRHLTGL
jgi:hypothetical protein